MKKQELVFAVLLENVLHGERVGTQRALSERLGISLSTVNAAVKPLEKMGAVQIKARSFSVLDPKKILLYWASRRSLEKDVRYQTRVARSPADIEKNMPAGTLFTAYTAYKLHFHQVPADYGEVYAYVDEVAEVKKRFPPARGPANLFVMEKPRGLPQTQNAVTLPHVFVDLWNIPTWYAKEYLNALEEKLHAILA